MTSDERAEMQRASMRSVQWIREMGRTRKWFYRRRLVKWLERNPPNGWLSRDAARLLVEGRLKWLDAGCPVREYR